MGEDGVSGEEILLDIFYLLCYNFVVQKTFVMLRYECAPLPEWVTVTTHVFGSGHRRTGSEEQK